MQVQFSVSVRSGRANSVETTIGTSPKIRIFDGTMPASCAAADSGTILAEIQLPPDWLTTSVDGTIEKQGAWQDLSCDASGTAVYWRLYRFSGTCDIQGDVSDQVGNGSMKLNDTNLIFGTPFAILLFGWTEGDS